MVGKLVRTAENHAGLTDAGIDLADALRLSKLDMEERLGVPVNSIAYPFGYVNDEVFRLTISYGFTSGSGLGASYTHNKNTIYYLSRIEIENEISLDQFIAKLPWSGPIQ